MLGENDSAVLSADASDIDGDLSYVEFLVDGQSIAVDNTPPFQATWRAALGEHSVSAIATDAQGTPQLLVQQPFLSRPKVQTCLRRYR